VRHNILLVEDDDNTRALYGFTLANAGFRVKGVRNELEALTELEEHLPDVIVTDITMPVVDGLRFIEIFKNKAEFANIPVIALTEYGQNLQGLAKSAGADLAVEKPIDTRLLCDLVTSVLPKEH